jgi:DNA-binding IclR family transcriptional regulator
VTPGFASVAAAVLDHNAHPVAGIAVTYAGDPLSNTDVAGIVESVLRCAVGVTRRLGGRPPR